MDPFVGEIALFAGTFAPRGYALCNGQQLSITQNTALFAIIGTIYGGDGRSTFNLPNLIARVPVDQGQGTGLSNYPIGSTGGATTVTLQSTQMPAHNHGLVASTNDGTQNAASGQMLSAATTGGRVPTSADIYSVNNPAQPLAAASLQSMGNNGAHNNLMPYQALNYIIALQGIFPVRS